MKSLTFNEIDQVSGANTIGDGLTCAGSLIVVGASDGTALVLGAGLAAIGSCVSFMDDVGLGVSPSSFEDNGLQCVYNPS